MANKQGSEHDLQREGATAVAPTEPARPETAHAPAAADTAPFAFDELAHARHRTLSGVGVEEVVPARQAHIGIPRQHEHAVPSADVEAPPSHASRRLFGDPLSREQLDALFHHDQSEVRVLQSHSLSYTAKAN